jgi:hypothetical protein
MPMPKVAKVVLIWVLGSWGLLLTLYVVFRYAFGDR